MANGKSKLSIAGLLLLADRNSSMMDSIQDSSVNRIKDEATVESRNVHVETVSVGKSQYMCHVQTISSHTKSAIVREEIVHKQCPCEVNLNVKGALRCQHHLLTETKHS